MTAQVIQRDRLGVLTKIGQGGQGVVYGAPKVKTKFAASMVYKEYKTQTRAGIDFTALAAMPALVEDSLSYAQAERLISMAAWPCALVEEDGTPTGFVMPAIPEQFFIPLTTVKGVSSTTAEFQHLLNHSSVLAARGIELDDAQRYSLLREVASELAFLHKHGVCVGDISPKNLLFSLTPHEAVYFIDCDAMRINTVSALPQVETPGWDIPSGEELATIYSDTYKLGLLALRLLAGDHDTTNPQHLPPATPDLVRQIITDTLTNPPHQRPLPEAWTYVLGHAIEQAQHRKNTAAAAAPVSVALDPPPTPVVHSRPTTAKAHSRPPVSAPPPPPPISAPPPSTTNLWPVLALTATVAVVVVAAVVLVAALRNNTNNAASTGPASLTTGASAYPSYSYPTSTTSSWNTPTVSVRPPMVQSPDSYGVDCSDGYHLTNQSGWATHSGRSTQVTSCQFANNVLLAYWNNYSSPGPNSREVIVGGTRPCPEVRANANPAPSTAIQCSGDNFVMTCAVYGNDPWITCRGGNNAEVYLY
jgi:eukaryotic-like serine/threonine-protein kinase